MIETQEMPVDVTESVITLDADDLVLARALHDAHLATRAVHADLFKALSVKYDLDPALPHRLDTQYIETGSAFLTKLTKGAEIVTDPNAEPLVTVEDGVDYADLPPEAQAIRCLRI